MNEDLHQQKIILFDGVCNLCNGSVVFVLQHEPVPLFKFASLQSPAGSELLQWCGLPGDYSEAVLFIDQGRFYSGSTAALKIGQTLKFPWSILATLGFAVPKFMRDWVYGQIAKHRYDLLSKSWFGKRDVCMMPTKSLQQRFL